jgi:hypothetical protein
VADLVAEVAEDRSVRLAELFAHLLAVGVIGLGEVERDHAAGVTGGDRLGAAGQQLEGQAALALAPALDRQPELAELEQQPALGLLGDAPLVDRLGVVVGRARAGQQTPGAQLALGVHEPVAADDVEVRAARPRAGRQGQELAPWPVEPELGAAAQARGVLEEDELSTGSAGEGAHGPASVARVATIAARPIAYAAAASAQTPVQCQLCHASPGR